MILIYSYLHTIKTVNFQKEIHSVEHEYINISPVERGIPGVTTQGPGQKGARTQSVKNLQLMRYMK